MKTKVKTMQDLAAIFPDLVAKDRGMWLAIVNISVDKFLFEVNTYATKTACE